MGLSRRVWIIAVLSLVWAVGAGMDTHNGDVERAEAFAKFSYKICTDGKDVNHDSDLSSCDAERAKNLKTWMEGSNGNVAFMALVPIPFFWLAAFILLYVVRAQITGFRAAVPWAALSPFRKLFVVFCALVSFAAVLFGTIMVLNLYIDTKVPVSPDPFLNVIKTGDNLVSVEGTWTRTDLTDDTIMNPLQTSKIECNKAENRCTEALASVSGSVLMSDIVEYEVQSWTPDAIVIRKDFPCATELFTIDLNTNAVSGAGHRINDNSPLCKTDKDEKDSWTYQLSNGFNVYWGLRQKARPLMLRVVHSFFGN
jgi:hypothetical protein